MKSGSRQDSFEGSAVRMFLSISVTKFCSFFPMILMKFFCNAVVTAEASQNGGTMHGSQNGGPNTPPMMVNQTMPIMPMAATGAPGVPGPTTNLNIGMDYWGAATSSTLPALRGKAPPTPVAGGMVTAGSRDSVQSQLWLQVSLTLISFLFCL